MMFTIYDKYYSNACFIYHSSVTYLFIHPKGIEPLPFNLSNKAC